MLCRRFLTTIENAESTRLLFFRRMSAAPQKHGTAPPFHLPSETATVGETAAYMDVVAMQKMLLLVYLPLPILLAMLVSEVKCGVALRKPDLVQETRV